MTEIILVKNGPLLVKTTEEMPNIKITKEDNEIVYLQKSAAICRCGKSSKGIFCDGTHKQDGIWG